MICTENYTVELNEILEIINKALDIDIADNLRYNDVRYLETKFDNLIKKIQKDAWSDIDGFIEENEDQIIDKFEIVRVD